MSRSRIPPELRRKIAEEAGYRCGYCLTPEGLSGARLEIDHLLPRAAGGETVEENLWLACAGCNRFKGAQTHGRDPKTGRKVRLFNPRRQRWADHFLWSPDGTRILGRTPCGRATVEALRLNRPELILARRLWRSVGWWPPVE